MAQVITPNYELLANAQTASPVGAAISGLASGYKYVQDMKSAKQQQALSDLAIKQKQLEAQYEPGQLQNQAAMQAAALQQQQIVNKYLPQKSASENLSLQLGNQQQQIINKSLPQKIQLELQKAQITNQLAPYTALGQYYGGIGKLQQSSLSGNPAYIVSRMVNSPAVLSMAATNPDFARNLSSTIKNITQNAANATGSIPGGMANNIPMIDPQTMQQVKNISDQVDAVHQQNPQLAQQSQPPAVLTPEQHHAMQVAINTNPDNPDELQSFQTAMGDALLKHTTTAQIMNQRQYGSILDNLFDNAEQTIPSVSQYAGLVGKGKKGIDALASSVGNTSPTYSNYLYFTRTLAPAISNEMRRTLGGQATDNEQKIMSSLANPAYWDSNPTQAKKQWDMLVNMYKKSVNPALAATPSQTVAKLNQQSKITSSVGSRQPSQEDIEYTAKKYGMTTDQVKAKLGIQ